MSPAVCIVNISHESYSTVRILQQEFVPVMFKKEDNKKYLLSYWEL